MFQVYFLRFLGMPIFLKCCFFLQKHLLIILKFIPFPKVLISMVYILNNIFVMCLVTTLSLSYITKPFAIYVNYKLFCYGSQYADSCFNSLSLNFMI